MGYTMSREAFLSYQGLFDVKICEDSRSPVRKSRLGNHPQKTLLLILERNYMAYVVQVFLPSIFFVLIAWLSILIPPTMLRTRLLLNSTNLLTILSMFLAVSKTESASIPKVSYLTALNLWMFVCVSFTFTSVLLVIFDIRLISLLTNSVGKLQPIKRVLLDVYQQSSGGKGRRGTEFAAELDYLAHLHQAAIEASASARGSGSWSEDGSDKPEAAQDDDGDLFEDASGVTPVPSFEAPRPGRVEVRVRRKRRLWLEMTAFYERLYLLAFPALFVLFLIVFVSYYRWTRHVQLDSLMEIVGRGESFYPGCWCARGDSWAGCMPESEYEKLK
ncbi:glycine receptor subunit alpha-1-like [Pollicipes pollicipes]|uniref:glycine receptor subunit alpha-1-like n=1 Tax=Pollicipes pollicipes TaxID=41117 RepID=UPI0018856431|nr:glycine receptor subunit alpha-1-like [Pollicipes pollicipes]